MSIINRLLLATLLLSCSLAVAAQPVVEWSSSYGGESFEEGQSLVAVPGGGFIMVGGSSSPISGTLTEPTFGSQDYLIVRVNADGTIAWERRLGGDNIDVATEVFIDSRGQVIVAGRSRSRINGAKTTEVFGFQEIWIVTLDLDGNLLWQQSYGGTAGEEPFGIVEADNGNLLIGARTDSEPHPTTPQRAVSLKGPKSYWLFEISSTGDYIQEYIYGGDGLDDLWGMRKLSDGSILLFGTSQSGNSLDKTSVGFGSSDMWLLRVDQQGNIINQYTFGGDQAENPFFVTEFSNGDLFVSGQSVSGVSGNKSTPALGALDLWCVRFNQTTGDIIWDQTFGGVGNDNAYTASINVNDYVLLAGNTQSPQRGNDASVIEGDDDGWMKYISPDGEKIWDITKGGNRSENIRGLIRSENGGWYLVGESNSDRFDWKDGIVHGGVFGTPPNTTRGNDIWYAKLECDFELELGVRDTSICLGEELILRNENIDDVLLHTSYLWSDGSTDSTLTISPSQDLTVTLQSVSPDACEAADTLDIVVHANPTLDQLTVVDESCAGQSDGSIFFEASLDAINFEFGGATYTAPQMFEGLSEGDYNFRVNSTLARCGFDTTVSISSQGAFSIDLGSDREVVVGSSVTLNANPTTTDSLTYTWSGMPGLCENCERQTVRLTESAIVVLIATNADGCTAESRVILNGIEDKRVGIPNAISPNNDGVNDRLAVFASPFVEKMGPMRIFDRWGNLVYVGIGDQLTIVDGWDGTFSGKPVQEGVFTYILPVTFLSGEERIFQGEVNVIR